MCDNKGEAFKDWGTKCTIDAKKLGKIFFITPGDGVTANIKVSGTAVLLLQLEAVGGWTAVGWRWQLRRRLGGCRLQVVLQQR